ncbi:MAG TPA: calcium/proton exchanger [Myxococcaceae bacterium]|nr:calcium/proton exchanger [Myxococcaceae bacterium]
MTATPSRPRLGGADIVFLALLVFVPATVVAAWLQGGTWVFVLAALALIPLARWIGTATEAVAHHVGPGIGGLLNATFGNAAELIVGVAALRAGQTAVVKASITGSILGNLLFVFGATLLAAGLKEARPKFNATAALSSSALMYLAVVGLVMPDLFHATLGPSVDHLMRPLSLLVSVILVVLYALSLLFSVRHHGLLEAGDAVEAELEGDDMSAPRPWSAWLGIAVLLVSTAATVLVSELLVGSLEMVIEHWGLTPTFVGVIVIAVVGNAAEHSTAVLFALKKQLDVGVSICFESSKQIALLVAPLLVFLSGPLGHPITLEFGHLEVVSLALAVGATALVTLDGETHWLEGAMLIGVYAILALIFFFVP